MFVSKFAVIEQFYLHYTCKTARLSNIIIILLEVDLLSPVTEVFCAVLSDNPKGGQRWNRVLGDAVNVSVSHDNNGITFKYVFQKINAVPNEVYPNYDPNYGLGSL